jgi:vacuolar-type H+-ATPase subunit H
VVAYMEAEVRRVAMNEGIASYRWPELSDIKPRNTKIIEALTKEIESWRKDLHLKAEKEMKAKAKAAAKKGTAALKEGLAKDKLKALEDKATSSSSSTGVKFTSIKDLSEDLQSKIIHKKNLGIGLCSRCRYTGCLSCDWQKMLRYHLKVKNGFAVEPDELDV